MARLTGAGEIEEPVNFHRRLLAHPSPWSITAEIGELYLLRGVIVSAFAHVDQIAIKLAIRASQVSEYAFRPGFPPNTAQRIDYLRAVAGRDGPLAAYRNILLSLLRRLEALNEFRTRAAHAGSSAVVKRMISLPETIKMKGKRRIAVSKHNSTTLDEMYLKAAEYAKFSRLCDRLYGRMSDSGLLPEVRFQGGWHSSLSPIREDLVIDWGYQPED